MKILIKQVDEFAQDNSFRVEVKIVQDSTTLQEIFILEKVSTKEIFLEQITSMACCSMKRYLAKKRLLYELKELETTEVPDAYILGANL